MLMTFGVVTESGDQWKSYIKRHVESWQRRVEYLNHVEGLFRAGREKAAILNTITTCTALLRRGKTSSSLGRLQ
jgi:hypothetical protein